MNWSIARLAVYAATFIATGLAVAGFGTFDAATGAFDLLPINIYELAAMASSGLAGLAVIFQWGKK